MTTASQPATPDKSRLVNEVYATDEPLSIRIETHRRYNVPSVDLPTWVLDRHSWRGDETVLDISTGNEQYLAPLRERIPHGRIVAGDLAPGMLRGLVARGVLLAVTMAAVYLEEFRVSKAAGVLVASK
jgi:hypothetical protein